MRIKKLTRQYRRDFQAVYECENCGHTVEGGGYDDRNFHDNVIPDMKCRVCGMSRNDMGLKGEEYQTRYPEDMQV